LIYKEHSRYAEADVEQIQMNLLASEKVAHGTKAGGPIALMDIPSVFGG
jgi:hypothetical protein